MGEGVSRGLRVSPSGACVCARARARSLELGQQQRALLEWCCAVLALGPSSPGRISYSRMGIDRAGAEASGFDVGLGTEEKNKEGFLSKGDPSLRGSPFPWRKRLSGIIPFFSRCSQFSGESNANSSHPL